jgi:hypothetical protein
MKLPRGFWLDVAMGVLAISLMVFTAAGIMYAIPIWAHDLWGV